MGLLTWMALAGCALASCYSPDTRDCTVSCEHSFDCTGGQVCGSDRFCASPAMAGRCASMMPPIDASAPADARPVDAAPPPDAPPDAPGAVALQIEIMGPGTVALDGVGSCDKACTLFAPFALPATLRALPAPKQKFASWTQGPCTGQGAVCAFLPLAPVTIAARFIKADP